jgi:hypothetical protein
MKQGRSPGPRTAHSGRSAANRVGDLELASDDPGPANSSRRAQRLPSRQGVPTHRTRRRAERLPRADRRAPPLTLISATCLGQNRRVRDSRHIPISSRPVDQRCK